MTSVSGEDEFVLSTRMQSDEQLQYCVQLTMTCTQSHMTQSHMYTVPRVAIHVHSQSRNGGVLARSELH